jgi:hypothetical protein
MKAEIETQVCTKCGLEKPLSEYYVRDAKQNRRRDCKACLKSQGKVYRKANPEKCRAHNKAWRKANREKFQANNKVYYQANREKILAQNKAYVQSNAEKVRAVNKTWRETNREKLRARNAKRRAAKLQATPAWADLKEIQDFYVACPPGHHVDHIYPLKSPIMCGLHVENNLQYLPAKENISKGNRVTLEQQLNG